MSELTSVEALITLLLNCVCTELDTAGRPVCSCAVRHAIQWPSMEGCCECEAASGHAKTHGQAWARFQRAEPVQGTPRADNTQCGRATQVTIDLGVHRCVSAFDGNSARPPTPAQYTADSLALINDEYHIRRALSCCPEPQPAGALAGWRWDVTTSLPLGPMGGCAGVVVTVVATGIMRAAPVE